MFFFVRFFPWNFSQKTVFREKWLWKDNLSTKFSILECGVLEQIRQHGRISLETNFQENQKTLHETVYYVFGKIVIKCRFETKYRFFEKNFKKKPNIESH